jgi:hypothetical protein
VAVRRTVPVHDGRLYAEAPMPVLGDNVGYALGSVAAAGEPGSGEPMVTLVVDLDEREPSTGEQPDAEPDEPDAGEPGGDAE